jgi:hypothetical protein
MGWTVRPTSSSRPMGSAWPYLLWNGLTVTALRCRGRSTQSSTPWLAKRARLPRLKNTAVGSEATRVNEAGLAALPKTLASTASVSIPRTYTTFRPGCWDSLSTAPRERNSSLVTRQIWPSSAKPTSFTSSVAAWKTFSASASSKPGSVSTWRKCLRRSKSCRRSQATSAPTASTGRVRDQGYRQRTAIRSSIHQEQINIHGSQALLY